MQTLRKIGLSGTPAPHVTETRKPEPEQGDRGGLGNPRVPKVVVEQQVLGVVAVDLHHGEPIEVNDTDEQLVEVR